MSLRELVKAPGCEDGQGPTVRNPLARFMDHMYREGPSGSASLQQQEMWRQQQRMKKEMDTRHEEKLETQTSLEDSAEVQRQMESFLEDYDKMYISRPPENFRPSFVPGFEQIRNEFQEPSLSYEEMERIYQQAPLSYEEMDRIYQEQQEQQFEQAFREGEETERLVEEFEGRRQITKFRERENLEDLTYSITQIKDPKLQNSNFMKFMNKISNGEVEFVGNQVVDKNPEMATDNMVNEFEAFQKENKGEIDTESWVRDFEERYKNSMDSWLDEYDNYDAEEWVRDFNSYDNTSYLREYEFTDPAENPYMGFPEAFKEGIRLFNEGKIDQAVLAFEAEVQQNSQNSKAWQYLGQAHAENDKDGKAIAALIRATETDPENLDSMLALAVSYTNDLFRDHALDTLRSWIEKHPDYHTIKLNMPNFYEGYAYKEYHAAVTDMFINAARMKPNNPDPDVQTALGLLFNLSTEYSKAVDCFKAALQVRSDDYLLWNKLGATLANSSRSEEALSCYFRALKIKPSYVRARANLGISFMALKEYEKAAQYFLGALDLHPDAKHIWTNLQMVFMSMGRDDLVEKSTEKNIELFRDEFEF